MGFEVVFDGGCGFLSEFIPAKAGAGMTVEGIGEILGLYLMNVMDSCLRRNDN